jgi:uncharacterized protein YndB with AHSA1/START domain
MNDDDPTSIRVDQFFPHSVERVWQTLTTSRLMARWLMPNDFVARVGHTFELQAVPIGPVDFSGVVACEVLELQPQRILRISWRDAHHANTLRSEVTWTLEPEGTGTRMFLVHEGFDPDDPTHQLSRQIMSGGWRSHVMRSFEAVLESAELNVTEMNREDP